MLCTYGESNSLWGNLSLSLEVLYYAIKFRLSCSCYCGKIYSCNFGHLINLKKELLTIILPQKHYMLQMYLFMPLNPLFNRDSCIKQSQVKRTRVGQSMLKPIEWRHLYTKLQHNIKSVFLGIKVH